MKEVSILIILLFYILGGPGNLNTQTTSKSIEEPIDSSSIEQTTYSSYIDAHIFGFEEFLSFLAILVVIYSSLSDIRTKFRLSIIPIPFLKLILGISIILGLLTITGEIFLYQKAPWAEPLLAIFTFIPPYFWKYYAYLFPPKFSKSNYKRFFYNLHHTIINGNSSEKSIIANEIERSTKEIIRLRVPRKQKRKPKAHQKPQKECHDSANEILSLIGNRPFTDCIMRSTPITAIALFEEISRQNQALASAEIFARNIVASAILNKSSLLYQEDHYIDSGALGIYKSFTNSVAKVSQDSWSPMDSPMALNYRIKLDSEQFKAYTRLALACIEEKAKSNNPRDESIDRAIFYTIESLTYDIYKLKEDSLSPFFNTDEYNTLQEVIRFINNTIKTLDENISDQEFKFASQNIRSRPATNPIHKYSDYIYDSITELMYEVIKRTSGIKDPQKAHDIQHNTIWEGFFRDLSPNNKTGNLIRRQLIRKLWSEIQYINRWKSPLGCSVLGTCLSVLGLKEERSYHKNTRHFHRAILTWTQKNFLRIQRHHPNAIDYCLQGSIAFDPKNKVLIKSFRQPIDGKPAQHTLKLNEPRTWELSDIKDKNTLLKLSLFLSTLKRSI